MAEYKELQGVKRICGDYAAWHEIGTYCEYVFGHRETLGEIGENLCETLNVDWEDLDELSLEALENGIKKMVQDSDGDYCDIEIGTVLCKMENGKILKTYMEL